jgi:hypothetical protein
MAKSSFLAAHYKGRSKRKKRTNGIFSKKRADFYVAVFPKT